MTDFEAHARIARLQMQLGAMEERFARLGQLATLQVEPPLQYDSFDGVGATLRLSQPAEKVLIRNLLGSSLGKFSVVGLGDPALISSNLTDGWTRWTTFEAANPTQDEPFAIVQERDIPDNCDGQALIDGVTQVLVSFSDTSHGYADAITSNYTRLASQSGVGPAKILKTAIPAAILLNGAINDVVTTITVDANTGWPDIATFGTFVVTIDTEDLLVTATSGTGNITWTVTRGYNSTTPASHLDNATVTYKTGVVWAVVQLTGAAGGGSGITSINADTTPDQLITSADSSVTIDNTTPGTTDLSVAAIVTINSETGPDITLAAGTGIGVTVTGTNEITITNTSPGLNGSIETSPSTGTATGPAYVFTTGTSGSDFNISAASSTATFNLPDAGSSVRGVITTGTQTIAGAKTFTSTVTISAAGLPVLKVVDTSLSNSTANFGIADVGGGRSGVQFDSVGGDGLGGVSIFYAQSLGPSPSGAGTITNATNATPIVITSTGHGLSTGNEITIIGVGGNTAANGTWTVTVVDADTFSLDTSVGNGAYSAGGTWNSTISDHAVFYIGGIQGDNNIDPEPSFGVVTTGSVIYRGAWATVSGLVFKGGLYISGSMSIAGADIASGLVGNTYGGTGADLSGTGPGVLVQASSGTSVTVVQGSSTGETTGFTAGGGTAVNDDSTFTGNTGSTAYTVSDIVKHLKAAKLLAD